MRSFAPITAFFALLATSGQAAPVADAQDAIAIAVAIGTPLYGKERLEGEKPYRAFLTNGVWHVSGSMPKKMLGGVAVAEIRAADGEVLRVTHGK